MNKFEIENLELYYGDFKALKNINMNISPNEITAFIGPSGCGKSTLLKTLDRMNDCLALPIPILYLNFRSYRHRLPLPEPMVTKADKLAFSFRTILFYKYRAKEQKDGEIYKCNRHFSYICNQEC